MSITHGAVSCLIRKSSGQPQNVPVLPFALPNCLRRYFFTPLGVAIPGRAVQTSMSVSPKGLLLITQDSFPKRCFPCASCCPNSHIPVLKRCAFGTNYLMSAASPAHQNPPEYSCLLKRFWFFNAPTFSKRFFSGFGGRCRRLCISHQVM